MDMVIDIVADALLDSVKLLPFLFAVYLVIGYLEKNNKNILYKKMMGAKATGPIIGALIGCVPQCGFSVVGSNLYSQKFIGLGTLLAIFISTSDEAIPILLSEPEMIGMVVPILVIKVVIGIIAGLAIECVMCFNGSRRLVGASGEEVDVVELVEEGSCCCGGHHHEEKATGIWKNAAIHTATIFMYILIINLVLGSAITLIGEDQLGRLLLTNSMWQPALAALVGLIPNCAASIVLTEMYVAGSISLGALIAGLCTGAGVGLMVLFKTNKNKWDNLKIVGLLYVIGTVSGLLIQWVL